MIYYLVFGVSVVAVLLAVGIPAVTKLVRIPARVRLRPVNDSELSEKARSYFESVDAEALAIGFQHELDFVLSGHMTPNENRLYYRPSEGTMLVVSLQSSGSRSVRLFELITALSDGTEITTTNAPVSLVFEEPPWQDIKRLPNVSRLESLYNSHKSRVAKSSVGIRNPEEDRLLEEISESQARLLKHQVEAGLFREDEESGMYVATYKVALRSVANILNPFTEEFTWSRFAVGVGASLGLYLGALSIAREAGLSDFLRDLLPGAAEGQVVFVVFAPCFVLAGLVAGFAFTRKGFLWGFLVSLPAILFALGFQPDLSHPIFYSLISAQSGRTANVLGAARKESSRQAASTTLLVLFFLLVVGYYYLS